MHSTVPLANTEAYQKADRFMIIATGAQLWDKQKNAIVTTPFRTYQVAPTKAALYRTLKSIPDPIKNIFEVLGPTDPRRHVSDIEVELDELLGNHCGTGSYFSTVMELRVFFMVKVMPLYAAAATKALRDIGPQHAHRTLTVNDFVIEEACSTKKFSVHVKMATPDNLYFENSSQCRAFDCCFMKHFHRDNLTDANGVPYFTNRVKADGQTSKADFAVPHNYPAFQTPLLDFMFNYRPGKMSSDGETFIAARVVSTIDSVPQRIGSSNFRMIGSGKGVSVTNHYVNRALLPMEEGIYQYTDPFTGRTTQLAYNPYFDGTGTERPLEHFFMTVPRTRNPEGHLKVTDPSFTPVGIAKPYIDANQDSPQHAKVSTKKYPTPQDHQDIVRHTLANLDDPAETQKARLHLERLSGLMIKFMDGMGHKVSPGALNPKFDPDRPIFTVTVNHPLRFKTRTMRNGEKVEIPVTSKVRKCPHGNCMGGSGHHYVAKMYATGEIWVLCFKCTRNLCVVKTPYDLEIGLDAVRPPLFTEDDSTETCTVIVETKYDHARNGSIRSDDPVTWCEALPRCPPKENLIDCTDAEPTVTAIPSNGAGFVTYAVQSGMGTGKTTDMRNYIQTLTRDILRIASYKFGIRISHTLSSTFAPIDRQTSPRMLEKDDGPDPFFYVNPNHNITAPTGLQEVMTVSGAPLRILNLDRMRAGGYRDTIFDMSDIDLILANDEDPAWAPSETEGHKKNVDLINKLPATLGTFVYADTKFGKMLFYYSKGGVMIAHKKTPTISPVDQHGNAITTNCGIGGLFMKQNDLYSAVDCISDLFTLETMGRELLPWILAIVSRQSLAEALSHAIGTTNYINLSRHDKGKELRAQKSLSIQYDSLYRLRDQTEGGAARIRAPHILILDETESLMSHTDCGTMSQTRQDENFAALGDLMKNSLVVYAADADMAERTRR